MLSVIMLGDSRSRAAAGQRRFAAGERGHHIAREQT
jgi:hypothetical protein